MANPWTPPQPTPDSYVGEAGPDPHEVLGGQMAYEMASRGYNPWQPREAATQYLRDLRIPAEAQIHFRQMDLGGDDPRMGSFSAPARLDSGLNAPMNPLQSTVEVAPDLNDAQRLLTIRHELEHAKDYYSRLYGGGLDAITAPAGEHFDSGPEADVERGFIARPWMLPVR